MIPEAAVEAGADLFERLVGVRDALAVNKILEAAVPHMLRTIETDPGLADLAHNSVVRSADGEMFQKYGDRWYAPGTLHAFSKVTPLPATVLLEGDIK